MARIGVCEPALKPCGAMGRLMDESQGFEPDSGNLTVRDYRGASGNVVMAEMCTHLATERARLVTLRLQPARPSSIPTVGKNPWAAGADSNLQRFPERGA